MGEVNRKGFEKKPVANSKSVGMQGAGGPIGSGEVAGVMGGTKKMSPKKVKSGMGSLQQDAVQPKVGK